MSSKYKVGESAIPHFMTFAVVGWIDVFSREQYKTIFVESLQYCQAQKGMVLHAWVIMTNHVHLIMSSNSNRLEEIVRDLKKYTSKQIIKAILENNTLLAQVFFQRKATCVYQFWRFLTAVYKLQKIKGIIHHINLSVI